MELDELQGHSKEVFTKPFNITPDKHDDSDDNGVVVCVDVGDGEAIHEGKKTFFHRHENKIRTIIRWTCLVGFVAYFVAVMVNISGREWTEANWRLVIMTAVAGLIMGNNLLNRTRAYCSFKKNLSLGFLMLTAGRTGRVIKWILYLGMTTFMVVYVVLNVAMKRPENLRSLMGLAVFTFLLFLYSNNRRKINWHTVYWGMSLQFIMALLILKTKWGAYTIQWVGDRLTEFLSISSVGSTFLFGEKYTDHQFVFGAMIRIFAMVVGISVLTYYGVITFVVDTVGRGLSFCLQTAPVEGINAVANIFLHVPESAILIQEYLPKMTPSQLFVTYAGGLATVGGGSLVIFMSSGVPAAPLVAASAMSAPAALAAAKLVFPSHPEEVLQTNPKNKDDAVETDSIRKPKSLADAIFLGINQSVPLVVSACAFIMTFIMIMEFINRTLTWFGSQVGVEELTIGYIFSYVFYPVSFLMGARYEDCMFIGELLGVRTFSLAIVAFPILGPIVVNGETFRRYQSESPNNTWTFVENGIFLDNTNETLVGGVIDARSETIATYALCGSASFAVMGYIIGTFSAVIPSRRAEITQHILRAMIVGTVASYYTACFAGLLFDE